MSNFYYRAIMLMSIVILIAVGFFMVSNQRPSFLYFYLGEPLNNIENHNNTGKYRKTISDQEAEDALKRWVQYVRDSQKPEWNPVCKPFVMGRGNGRHDLCDLKTKKDCVVYSFGIGGEVSWDTEAREKFGCEGYGFDPTVSYGPELAPGVKFLKVGAKMLTPEENGNWNFTSVPNFKKKMNHKFIGVLKMDCEGCEYSLGDDILNDDPEFFYNVNQFAVEIHIANKWIKT